MNYEKNLVTFKTMISSSYFGEIDIIFKRKRVFTVRTGEEETEIYYITRLEFV